MKEDLDPTQELPPTDALSEDILDEEETEKKIEVDRSAFNCSNCGGEGLIWHEGAKRHERCPACSGTGKVN